MGRNVDSPTRFWIRPALIQVGFVLAFVFAHANAQIFQCTDASGHQVLRNFDCEQGEKQQAIPYENTGSYLVIDSTGEVDTFRPGPLATTDSAKPSAPMSIEARARAFADSEAQPGDPPEIYNSHLNEAFRNLTGATGVNGDSIDVQPPQPADETYDDQSQEPPPPPIEDYQNTPSVIREDQLGLRDDLGGRYNHLIDNVYSNPSGNGNCRLVGNLMYCP